MIAAARALLIVWATAAAACALDDRTLTVSGACQPAPADGVLADFSVSRVVRCPAGICAPALVGASALSLGAAPVRGELFPYAAAGLPAVAMGLVPDTSTPERALRIALNAGTPTSDAANDLYDGVALQLFTCLDASAYAAIRFTIAGSVGNCPLAFAPQFQDTGGSVFPHAPCPLSDCQASTRIPVVVGTTTVPLPAAATALVGLQWELTLQHTPESDRCAADFTLDDIRLDTDDSGTAR